MGWVMTDLLQFVLKDETLNGLLSSHVWVDRAPDKTPLPHAVLHGVSDVPQNLQAGRGEIRKVLVQIDVFAESVSDAEKIASAFQTRLHGFKGVMGSAYVGRTAAKKLSVPGYDPATRTYQRLVEVEVGTK